MLNLLIAYDDTNINRGDYFRDSHDHLVSNLTEIVDINRLSIGSLSCNDQSIDHYISQFKGEPHVFVAYAHGSEEAIQITDIDYIHNKNAYLFSETLFYACSCLTAQKLGQKLIEHGCRVFLGYNKKISSGNPETEPIYFTCENAFLVDFLLTGNSIEKSLDIMYDKYTEMIKHLRVNYGVFDASILDANLDSFEIICNKKDLCLTKIDFQLL